MWEFLLSSIPVLPYPFPRYSGVQPVNSPVMDAIGALVQLLAHGHSEVQLNDNQNRGEWERAACHHLFQLPIPLLISWIHVKLG